MKIQIVPALVLAFLIAAILAVGHAATYTPASGRIQIVIVPPADPTVTSYNLYASTNLAAPLATWQLVTNVPAYSTNGTGVALQTTNLWIQIIPGEVYFFATSSNWFWESGPSNITNTPAMPAWPSLAPPGRTN